MLERCAYDGLDQIVETDTYVAQTSRQVVFFPDAKQTHRIKRKFTNMKLFAVQFEVELSVSVIKSQVAHMDLNTLQASNILV